MMLIQQWRYVHLNRNSFCILDSMKGIVNYKEIISSLFFVKK